MPLLPSPDRHLTLSQDALLQLLSSAAPLEPAALRAMVAAALPVRSAAAPDDAATADGKALVEHAFFRVLGASAASCPPAPALTR